MVVTTRPTRKEPKVRYQRALESGDAEPVNAGPPGMRDNGHRGGPMPSGPRPVASRPWSADR